MLKENEVVHCPTEELARQVLNIFHEHGLKWGSGANYELKSNYSYGRDTCYRPYAGSFGDKTTYLSEGKTIIPAQDFINKYQKMEDKLIGYKLIKPEYLEAVCKIGDEGVGCITTNETKYYLDRDGYLKPSMASLSYNNLKKAGVIDLWFEPVYEKKEVWKDVACDRGSFKVKVVEGGFEFESVFISKERITKIVEKMGQICLVGESWTAYIDLVNIGCKKNIPLESLKSLLL